MRRTARKILAAGLTTVALVAATVGAATGAPAAEGDSGGGSVILYNRLNGPWSVRHSTIGAGFGVIGSPVFRDGIAGRAVGAVDDDSLLTMSQRDFFGADRRQGTVSVFLKKRMVASVPYETPFPGVFGADPYDFQRTWCIDEPVKNPGSDSCTNYAVSALWGDGLSGPAGLYLQVVDDAGVTHQAVYTGFNTTAAPVGRWAQYTFVWDLAGIDGSADRLRIYRGDRVVARYSQPIDGVLSLPTPVSVAGTHAAGRLAGPALLLDELRVKDVAVTP